MPRLIDADEAKRNCERICDPYAVMAAKAQIDSTETVNAVPVVRCRECKYRFKNNGHNKDGCPIIDANIWMDDDDFCSHGERKEADNAKTD